MSRPNKRATPDPFPGVSYILRGIPADLWRQVKSKAAAEGVSAREVLLRALREYVR